MPASIAHFITLIETYHELKKGNESVFEAKPVKKNELRQNGGAEKTDKGISQYAYLGAVFPDLPYYNPDEKKGTEFAADLFHYNKSGTYAIKLIDYAKGKGVGSESGDRLMAFILGFVSHIACDVVCHPYINTIAGAYWNQLVPYIGKIELPMLPSRKGKVSMHMMTETHQDAWLAQSYFGLKDLSSTGSSKSWSDFIDDVGLGYFVGIKDRTVELFGDVRKCFEEVYGKKLEEEPLEDAGDNIFEAFDGSYDRALFPFPDKPSMNLVNYSFRGHDYWDYLNRAFTLSQALCKLAIGYYKGSTGKDDLKKYLKDWNLDMGYCINVEAQKKDDKIKSIHIRYEHSWCHNYGLYDFWTRKVPERPFYELALPIDPDDPYSPDDKLTLESEGGEYSKNFAASEGVDGGDGYLSFRFKDLINGLKYSAKWTSKDKETIIFTGKEITKYVEGTTEERSEAPPTFHTVVEEEKEEATEEPIEYEGDMPEYTEPFDIDL